MKQRELFLVESAPHKDINDINEQLHEQGFDTLTSEDGFAKTVACTSCGWKITPQDHAKVMWLIKRHSNENAHKVKAGWFLSTDNKVLASKPKGKLEWCDMQRVVLQSFHAFSSFNMACVFHCLFS